MKKLVIQKLGNFYDVEKLHKDFISYSEQVQNDNTLIFAFILYRSIDYNIASILDNRLYWNALDEVSGDKLCVYSLREDISVTPPAPFIVQMMISVSYSSIDRHVSPKKITDKLFESILNVPLEYPSILFFQVNDGVISDSILVPLVKKDENGLLEEIMSYFKKVDLHLYNMVVPNRSSQVLNEIFDELKEIICENPTSFEKVRSIVNNVLKYGTQISSLIYNIGKIVKDANS